jgi:hypothetical protein
MIVDVYDGKTFNRVDIPITPEEYERSFATAIGVTLS